MEILSTSELAEHTPERTAEGTLSRLGEDQRATTVGLSAEELKPITRRNSLLLAIVLMIVWAGRQLLPTFGGMIAVQLTGTRGLSGAMFAIYMLTGSTGAWQAGRWMD